MKKLATLAVAACLAGSSMAAILWDNGPMVTHPGQGAAGADVSMADPIYNIAGNNMRFFGPDPNLFTIADNFTVGGPGWIVNTFRAFGYETNAVTPGWTGATLNILNGMPGVGSSVGTFSSFTLAYSNINRVFNGAGNLTNTQRRIHSLTFNLGSLNLSPGTYWFTLQVTGGASGWYPHVMAPDPSGGTNTTTVNGDAMIFGTNNVWQPIVLTATGQPDKTPDLPFIVEGTVVPEPGTIAVIGLGLAALAARRRRK